VLIEKIFNPTYLYIKRHAVTGLLYLGKTSGSENYLLYEYNGSGNYWGNHLRIHGEDQVETIWYCLYTEKEELTKFALMCSEQWDIVKAKDTITGKKVWANEKPENGLDGGFDYINNNGLNGGSVTNKPGDMTFVTMLRERKLGRFSSETQSKWGKLGGKAATNLQRQNKTAFFDPNCTARINSKTPKAREKQKNTFKKIGHAQGKKNSQFGTCWATLPWAQISRRIEIEKLDEYISQGWTKGMMKKIYSSNRLL